MATVQSAKARNDWCQQPTPRQFQTLTLRPPTKKSSFSNKTGSPPGLSARCALRGQLECRVTPGDDAPVARNDGIDESERIAGPQYTRRYLELLSNSGARKIIDAQPDGHRAEGARGVIAIALRKLNIR